MDAVEELQRNRRAHARLSVEDRVVAKLAEERKHQEKVIKTAKPEVIVSFGEMIPKWASLRRKGKKAVQDMTTKCAAFTAWLEHDNMAVVSFENGRDWRDEMIEDGEN
jgi:hypothetical protein